MPGLATDKWDWVLAEPFPGCENHEDIHRWSACGFSYIFHTAWHTAGAPQMLVDYRLELSFLLEAPIPDKCPGMWWGDELINQLGE